MSHPINSASTSSATESASSMQQECPSSLQFSRTCGICYIESPCQRSVFIRCGHTTCRACAEQMRLEARSAMRHPSCPFCRVPSEISTLIEDIDEDDDAFLRELRNTAKTALRDSLTDVASPECRDWLILEFLDGCTFDFFKREFNASLQAEASRWVAEGRGTADEFHDKEIERYETDFPTYYEGQTFAEAASHAVWSRERKQLIAHLRSEDERASSAAHFDRTCHSCWSTSPRLRSVFTECGEIVCRECAEEIAEECAQKMDETKRTPQCPICGVRSHTVNLFEDLVE